MTQIPSQNSAVLGPFKQSLSVSNEHTPVTQNIRLTRIMFELVTLTREYTHTLQQGCQTNMHKDHNEKLMFQISSNFFSSNQSLGVLTIVDGIGSIVDQNHMFIYRNNYRFP